MASLDSLHTFGTRRVFGIVQLDEGLTRDIRLKIQKKSRFQAPTFLFFGLVQVGWLILHEPSVKKQDLTSTK